MSVIVRYNSFDFPEAVGSFSTTQDYSRFSFSCVFLVQEDTAAELVTSVNEIIAKAREPYEDLLIKFSANNEINFSHDSSTFLLPSCKIETVDSELNTETTRLMRFVCEAELQADKEGFDFRRDASFSVKRDSNNARIVDFDFEYTASSSTSKTSLQNFETFALPYALSTISSLGGNFEKIAGPTSTTEHERKITRGAISFREILDRDTKASLNDTRIINANVNYSVDFAQEVGISSNYTQTPPVIVSLSYSCDIDNDQISNDGDFEEIYRQSIKPWILEHSFDVLGLDNYDQAGNDYIILSDKHVYNRTRSTVAGSLVFMAPQSFTQITSLSETIDDQLDTGKVFSKLWDGKPFTHAKWEMGPTRFVNRTTSITQLGSLPLPPPKLVGDNFELLGIRSSNAQVRRGVGTSTDSNDAFDVDEFSVTYRESYIFAEVVGQETTSG